MASLAELPELSYQVSTIKHLYNDSENKLNKFYKISGWIKTFRSQKETSFLSMNDGSTIKCLQVVFDTIILTEEQKTELRTGVSVSVRGVLIQSPAKGQLFEMHIIDSANIMICGMSPESNPIAKTNLGLNYLRTIPHLRVRTNTFGAVSRIRHQLAMATHNFYGKEKEFVLVAPPQITSNDCEGGGEAFQLTTLLSDKTRLKSHLKFNSDQTQITDIDYSKDFFGGPAYLTVSGQLALETYCLALGGVYCYQSAFRADPSQTSRHVAEFTMLEVEIPFADLFDNMEIAEEYIKYSINHVLSTCSDDIEFLDKFYYQKREPNQKFKPSLIEYLNDIVQNDFIRMAYSKAMSVLLDIQKSGKHKFDTPIPESGVFDFKSEHERYLTDVVYKRPVFLTHYPAEIKAFYMKKASIDPVLGVQTVECCDLLVPGIGEVLGGSCRTSSLEDLVKSMEEHGLNDGSLDYYLDMRKYGSIDHCGFGIGMSRLMMMITGMENIRDVIEFPRTMGSIMY